MSKVSRRGWDFFQITVKEKFLFQPTDVGELLSQLPKVVY